MSVSTVLRRKWSHRLERDFFIFGMKILSTGCVSRRLSLSPRKKSLLSQSIFVIRFFDFHSWSQITNLNPEYFFDEYFYGSRSSSHQMHWMLTIEIRNHRLIADKLKRMACARTIHCIQYFTELDLLWTERLIRSTSIWLLQSMANIYFAKLANNQVILMNAPKVLVRDAFLYVRTNGIVTIHHFCCCCCCYTLFLFPFVTLIPRRKIVLVLLFHFRRSQPPATRSFNKM